MIDWQTIFLPDIPLMETFVRGTVIYFALLVLMRLSKRETGDIGLSDMLVVVLLADAIQNGMGGDYKSISNGLLLVVTILFWDFVVNWVSYYVPALGKLLAQDKICLVKDGKLLKKNMRQELITRDEILGHMRLQGIESIKDIKLACLESNGKISLIPKQKAGS